MKAAVLLALAAAGYAVAAWAVAPGFYDGIGPVQPYNWVSPPPEFVNGNLPPESGSQVIKVINGVSEANTAFTKDGQIVFYFLPGAFISTGLGSITVDIKPLATFPDPDPYHFSTNVYLVKASAPLVKPISVTLRYSTGIPAPSYVYYVPAVGGPWQALSATQQVQVFTVNAAAPNFGYYAAGYPNASKPSSVTIGGSLPIIVAAAIVLVILAGIPIAVLRRRGGKAADEEAGPEEP